MEKEQAEIFALQALAYLATQEDKMNVFANLSGLGSGDIMARAGESDLLAGVMDFLLSDEELLTDFCTAQNVSPETPARARQSLPGGQLPHWT
jgi:hypothetical protein